MLDLTAYFNRIGYQGPVAPDRKTLEALHFAHATRIPFENLDVLLKKPIRLDLLSLETKLIREARGGYCFEQNALFAAALEQIGFQLTRLSARVRMGSSEMRARTHMLLKIDIGDEAYIADVGFGDDGLLRPIPLLLDSVFAQFSWAYRLVVESEFYVLQSRRGTDWLDLYAFTLDRTYPADYEVANYYISTHPHSPFTRLIFVSLPGIASRSTLFNRRLIERGSDWQTETVLSDEAIVKILYTQFGLSFPEGTRFDYDESATI